MLLKAMLLILVLVHISALMPTSARAQGSEKEEEDLAGLDAGTGPRWGGVAEAHGIWLRAGDEPNARVQQGRLRLTLEQLIAPRHTLVAHVQGEWLHGSNASALERLRAAQPATDRVRRLGGLHRGERQQHGAEFDWLYVHGPWQHGRYSIGRQPINASLGRLWSPVDLFAPFHPDELVRLYKPGVDAAQLQWFIGDRLQATTIVSAARRPSGVGDDGTRLQWQQRVELEAPWGKAFVLGGTRRDQRIAGGGVQFNDVRGHDVYAELLWHHGPQARPDVQGRRGGVRTLLGTTRKLAENTLGTLEWMYQSQGIKAPALYDAFSARAATLDLPYVGTGRHYLGASVSARPHPLWGVDALLLSNLSDRSASLTLALEYTPQPNLKLRATASVPVAGRPGSEYRRQGQALQLSTQWFF